MRTFAAFLRAFSAHPVLLLLALYPLSLGILFGALGTVRNDLENGTLEDLAMTAMRERDRDSSK